MNRKNLLRKKLFSFQQQLLKLLLGFLYGYGKGIFESQITLDTGTNSHPSSITIVDFDGDTQLDIAVTNYGTKSVDILLGNGEGTYASQINYGTGFVSAPFFLSSMVICCI